MPASLLTDAERTRLGGFPQDIATEDLFAHFSLSGDDRALIPSTSAQTNRLGFAVALCTVRYFGFYPDDPATIPHDVAWYVGQQIMVSPDALAAYPEREQTRTEHLRRIYEYLGYRRPTQVDLRELFGWLVERAIEHDDPALLVSLAAERFKAEKLVRPRISRLERMAAAARERANDETFLALSPMLAEEAKAMLDALLIPEPEVSRAERRARRRSPGPAPGRTPHSWLREGATSNSPPVILAQLKKLEVLREMGVEDFDLRAINHNRLKYLANLGRRYTNQALQRQAPERRYPILLSFLSEAYSEITDEVVDLFDHRLQEAESKSKRDLAEFRQGAARATDEKVRLFRQLGRILLDPEVPDGAVREAVYKAVGSPEKLLEAVEESEKLIRPADDNYYDFFADRYSYLRQFTPAFLEALQFRSNKKNDPLLEAIAILRDLNAEKRRRIPEEAPLDFVPGKWGPYVVDGDGSIDRRYWELCLLTVLREALRSGDVWVEGSRRYADPQSYLIPKTNWPSLRQEVSISTGTPSNGAEHLAACRAEMEASLARLRDAVTHGANVQMQDEKLVFSRDRSEDLPDSVYALQEEIGKRLPKVELTDLLVEMDGSCSFSRRFTHAGGSEPRTPDLRVHLYASVLARPLTSARSEWPTSRNSPTRNLPGRIPGICAKILSRMPSQQSSTFTIVCLCPRAGVGGLFPPPMGSAFQWT